MPATLFSDLEFTSNPNQHQQHKVMEDTRALQVALELSMLYINGDQQQPKTDNSMSNNSMDTSSIIHSYIPNGFPEEPRSKKSQNMTECVPVPSSEHVAEIVGRQGNIITLFDLCSFLYAIYIFVLRFCAMSCCIDSFYSNIFVILFARNDYIVGDIDRRGVISVTENSDAAYL